MSNTLVGTKHCLKLSWYVKKKERESIYVYIKQGFVCVSFSVFSLFDIKQPLPNMKSQFLNRISHFFSSASSSSSKPDQHWASPTKVTTAGCCSDTFDRKFLLPNKARWATFHLDKKTWKRARKCNAIPVGEWLASPLTADNCNACKLTQKYFYDEKVEILVPSASTASFITSLSTTTLPQHIPFYFSTLSDSSFGSVQKNQHQTGAVAPSSISIDGREDSGIIVESETKNADFRRTYRALSIQVYEKDDFYD